MSAFSIQRRILAFIALSLLGCNLAFAQARQEAINMVNAAARFYEKNGMAMTVAEINKTKGMFVKGSLYVFAYDMEGTNVAHPFNPKLIGKNFLDTPDAGGTMYRRDILTGAKATGSGWVDYLYKEPTSGRIERKSTYYKRAGDIILCAGIYQSDK